MLRWIRKVIRFKTSCQYCWVNIRIIQSSLRGCKNRSINIIGKHFNWKPRFLLIKSIRISWQEWPIGKISSLKYNQRDYYSQSLMSSTFLDKATSITFRTDKKWGRVDQKYCVRINRKALCFLPKWNVKWHWKWI